MIIVLKATLYIPVFSAVLKKPKYIIGNWIIECEISPDIPRGKPCLIIL